MNEALELAERGRRLAHPNPRVGAVVVSADGAVVGRGFHRGPGTAHAEAAALQEAGAKSRDATLFVTLEPCCHHGLTPPCTDAIVAAAVRRVVAAQQDPNPEVDGRGFETLAAAGVAVERCDDDLMRRATELNRPFTRWITGGLPSVTLKSAVTLDGKVAAASGDARWISSAAARRRVHAMRAGADAVMVGAATVRRDDPLLTVRDADGDDPVRIVVSSAADLPLDAALVRGAGTTPTIIVADAVPADRAAALRDRGVEIVETRGAGLEAGLRALARRGLLDILCEGGPVLAAALLEAGLVDRLCVFVAATVVGRGAPDLVAAPAVARMSEAWRLADVTWEIVDGDALVCGVPVRAGDGGGVAAGGGED